MAPPPGGEEADVGRPRLPAGADSRGAGDEAPAAGRAAGGAPACGAPAARPPPQHGGGDRRAGRRQGWRSSGAAAGAGAGVAGVCWRRLPAGRAAVPASGYRACEAGCHVSGRVQGGC